MAMINCNVSEMLPLCRVLDLEKSATGVLIFDCFRHFSSDSSENCFTLNDKYQDKLRDCKIMKYKYCVPADIQSDKIVFFVHIRVV